LSREEFSMNIERNRKKLMRIARSMLRSCDCEDAVQGAILSAWEHLPQLRDEKAFDSWLMQIMINRCRQIQREYKKEKETYAAVCDQLQETGNGEPALQEALEAMEDEDKRLILLHHEQGYSIKELSAATGQSEAAVKMRLYRARNRLRIILITLLMLILLAAAAVGTGMLDVNWFLQNRRAEPGVIDHPIAPQSLTVSYRRDMLDVSVSDAVWNSDALSLSFVYSIAGTDEYALIVHDGNIGVDGVRHDHIWTGNGIVPVLEWADGKQVQTFSVDGWQLDGVYLTSRTDCLPDGLGETFMTELCLDWIRPERYEKLLDENGMLVFEADLTLEAYESGETLEAQKVIVKVGAPTPQEWRNMYETYVR